MSLTGGHAILQLHPGRRCNLRCLHCYSQSGPHVSEVAPLEQLTDVIEDAAGLGYDVVAVSGGEPLLFRDLPQLLESAKRHGMRTSVTSNGMLLTERRLGELAGLVDVLALSLDGTPATHDQMRGDPRAFRMLDRRIEGIHRSGIAFGFITTLTMHNVHELEFVVRYAGEHGARLVQVHPLELEGAARSNLPSSCPDTRESAFALVEAARLSMQYEIPVQVDIVSRTDLSRRPEAFLAAAPDSRSLLSTWLSPLVVETGGTVLPLTYGFPCGYALGNLNSGRLPDLVDAWEPAALWSLCRDVAERLLASGAPFFNWYGEVADEAHRRSEARSGSVELSLGRLG